MIYTFAMIILRDLSRTKTCDLDVTPSVQPTLLNFAETFAYQFLLAIVVYVVVQF